MFDECVARDLVYELKDRGGQQSGDGSFKSRNYSAELGHQSRVR